MSSTSPNFDDWRQLASIKVWEIASLMHGFDPRAGADVTVRDPYDPTSPYGVSPDLSWEIRRLISAVSAGDLATAPTSVVTPNDETGILKSSLVPWLRAQGEVYLADELDTSSQTNGSTAAASTVPINGTVTVWTRERKLAAQTMYDGLKAQGVRAYSAQTARAFCVSPARLRDVLADRIKKLPAKKPSVAWHPPRQG